MLDLCFDVGDLNFVILISRLSLTLSLSDKFTLASPILVGAAATAVWLELGMVETAT